jgi:formylglycine-generating enzyme required for sulfatase activity
MSTDLATRLRLLAQDHHDGRLSLAEYRKLRAPLLDSLASQELTGVDDEAVTRPRVAGRQPAVAPKAPERGHSSLWSRPRLRAVLVVGLLVLVALVGWSLRRWHAGAGPAGQPGEYAAAEPVYAVVRPFVERGDWSDARVNALNAALIEVGPRALTAAESEQGFERFVDEVRRRFKEQAALSAAPLTADNSPLAALAVTIGLDLNAPDAAIHLAPPETADSAVTPAGARVSSPSPVNPPQKTAVRVRAPEARDTVAAADRRDAGAVPEAPHGAGAVSTAAVPAPANGPAASAAAAQLPPRGGRTAPSTSPEPCRTELIGSRRPLCHDVLASGAVGPELALIPSGAFEMGSNASGPEGPVHHVTLRQPFAISVYEVSQAEFRAYCEAGGDSCAAQPWQGDDYPVVNVSWKEAVAYAAWLSSVTGQHYRLPTESEWEYAARAGQTGLFPSGDSLSATDAWFALHEAPPRPAPRSQQFNHNSFRLYHMVGNVREWVDDTWSGNFAGAPADGSARNSGETGFHVVRGGSYVDNASKLRLTTREGLPVGTRDALTGFRVVRELPRAPWTD